MKGAYRPKVMLVVVMLSALLFLAAAAFIGVKQRELTSGPEPTPTVENKVWVQPPVLVPVPSQACLDLAKTADAAVKKGLLLDETTTAAMEDQRKGRLSSALKKFAVAKKMVDDVKKARDAYNKLTPKCQKGKP